MNKIIFLKRIVIEADFIPDNLPAGSTYVQNLGHTLSDGIFTAFKKLGAKDDEIIVFDIDDHERKDYRLMLERISAASLLTAVKFEIQQLLNKYPQK